jgi:hypothetical protein
VIFTLTFLPPIAHRAEAVGNVHFGSSLDEDERADLLLLDFGIDTEEVFTHFEKGNVLVEGCPVYWSNDLGWLGFTLDSWASAREDEFTSTESQESGTLSFSPSFVLRYPSGNFQPYMGISPGMLMSTLAVDQEVSAPALLLGFSCSF